MTLGMHMHMRRAVLTVSTILALVVSGGVTAASAQEPAASDPEPSFEDLLNEAGLPGKSWQPEPDAYVGDEGGAAPSERWSSEQFRVDEDVVEREGAELEKAQNAAADTTWPAKVGDTGYFTFLDFPFFDTNGDVAVKVNVASGNLLVQSVESAIAGPGAGIDVTRVYNSFEEDPGDVSATWRTNVGSVGLDISSTEVVFHGKTGEQGVFTGAGPSYTAPAGLNASLERNSNGTYTLTYVRTGEKLGFSSAGWLTSDTDRNGTGVTYQYANNRVASATDATGKMVYFDYTGTPGTVSEITDEAGRSTTFTKSSTPIPGGLTSVTGFRGSWTMTYSTSSTFGAPILTSISNGAGKSIHFTHSGDAITKVTQKQTGKADIVTSLAYSAGQTVVTDPRGNTTEYMVDSKWRVTEVTDPLGNSRSQTFTPNSDVATVTDATSQNVTTNTYDGSNNLTNVELPTGAAAQAFYAAGTDCPNAQAGNPSLPKCTIDAGGEQTSYEYDTAGNLTGRSTTDGATFEYTYETTGTVCGGEAGQVCTAKDGNGNITDYTYTNGNLTTVTPPGPLGTTTYGYDSLGRVTSVTDGNNDTTGYGYDQRDRTTSTTYADSSTVLASYNPDGTTASQSDSAVSTVITSTYNLLNRNLRQTLSTSSPVFSTNYVTMTYDKNGNMLTHSTSVNGSFPTQYTYDAANRTTHVVSPGGACPSSGDAAPNSGCVRMAYDENNNETARVFPAGARVDSTYDGSNRATRITARDAADSVVADIGYSFTAAGQSGPSADRTMVQARTSHVEQGITAGAVTSYSYDPMKRLTEAEEQDGSTVTASWTYGYDDSGNRTSQVRTGTDLTPADIDYAYNAANQITNTTDDTSTWAYDGAGNQTRNGITGTQSTYGDRLNVTGIDGAAVSSFGQGNTLALKVNGSTTVRNSPLGITTTSTSGNTQWYNRLGDGEILSYQDGTTSPVTAAPGYFVKDTIGSVVAIFDGTGAATNKYSYSPYGELRSQASTIANPNSHTGFAEGFKVGDLYKFGARYYDPTLGTFTQPDPSGQERNLYAYASCNPVNNVDPTGLDCAGSIFGAVIGSIALAASVATLIAGAPTLILGAAGAVGFIFSITGVVYSIGMILNECF